MRLTPGIACNSYQCCQSFPSNHLPVNKRKGDSGDQELEYPAPANEYIFRTLSHPVTTILRNLNPETLKMATVKERIILGIDPGTNIMGYGIIRVIGTRPELITLGVLRLKRDDDHSLRLKQIFEYTLGLIDQHLPDDLAIEAPFFGKTCSPC